MILNMITRIIKITITKSKTESNLGFLFKKFQEFRFLKKKINPKLLIIIAVAIIVIVAGIIFVPVTIFISWFHYIS